MCCCIEGCGNRPAPTNKYCAKHWQNIMRYGHPESLRERYLADLLDATHRYGDRDDASSLLQLLRAAALYGQRRDGRLPYEQREEVLATIPRALMSPEVYNLMSAARAYTEHATSEDADATFAEAQDALGRAALMYFRALLAARREAA